MKILVSIVGIGLGHATRSEAIVKELRKKKVKVKVVTWGDAYKFLKKRGLEPENIGGYEYKGEDYSFNVMLNILDSFRDPSKLKKDYFRFAKIADEFKPDKILSDTDPNAFFYAHRRGIPNYMLSNLTTTINNYESIPKQFRTKDMMLQKFMIKKMIEHIQKRTSRIFTPSFESKIRYTENVHYTDVITRKKAKELPDEKTLRTKLGIKEDFYLVTVGGAEIEKHLFKIFKKVLPDFKDKKFIISSNHEVSKKTIEKNMIILPFIPNLLEYLKISKGIITPAGHSTISEAIAYQKPVLAIPIKNHVEQLVNAAVLKKQGTGHACFIKQKLNAGILKTSIEEFFKNEENIRKKLIQCEFRGNGAKEVADLIIS